MSVENVDLDDSYAASNRDARAGPHVRLSVSDTGSGIDAEALDRLFEPFFTTKEVGKGTGLGLSTSLAIVKSHGGFINVYSAPGEGARFDVYLPASGVSRSSAAGVAALGEPLQGHGELILMVDDEEAIRKICRRTLERAGYRVLLADHGREALALYRGRELEIAVVLTDMAMPVMGGAELIAALKALNPAVLVLGSSGLASEAAIEQALAAGAAEFVPKPYAAQTLLAALDRVLRGPRLP